MVVGSQARILYADAEGRIKIARAFNEAIKNKIIGPIILGRDHHDVWSKPPYRETSNIYDGSTFTADIQNDISDTLEALPGYLTTVAELVGKSSRLDLLIDGSEDRTRN